MFAIGMVIVRFVQLFRLMTSRRTCTHADRIVDAFDMPIVSRCVSDEKSNCA